MELGKKILEFRKKKGFSQEELGERVNVTRQTISNWELGETSPNPTQLKLLSKELNVSIDELLDNEVGNILVEKVSNTERLAGLILKIIKIFFITLGVIFLVCLFGIISFKFKRSDKNINKIERSIYCKIYGEEHGYNIVYDELTGRIFEEGGDSYFSDILDLDKYGDANQVFNIINDYVKKNNGTCEIINDKELNDIVDISIKEGTLTKTSVTILIKENIDYDISYGEPFWIEKYEDNAWKKLEVVGINCEFILPAYSVTEGKTLELKQDWSCMYGHLDKGIYRLVKDAAFECDIPITEEDKFLIWTEFEIK